MTKKNSLRIVPKFLKEQKRSFFSAFTLAEVLITLGIIGVVAALTIPTIITSCQKLITKTRVRKAYAILAQTTRMAEDEYGGVGTWNLAEGESWEIARDFTETYIVPYLKADYKCPKNNNEKNCDYSMHGLNGNKYNSIYKNKTYRFYLIDGTFVMVWAFYRPSYSGHKKRASIFFDINGPSKPNVVGKDIFKLEYIIESTKKDASKIEKILPAWIDEDRTKLLSNKSEMCNVKQDGTACLALIYRDSWEIARDYPWK